MPSGQPTLDLDVEEQLLDLPMLRIGTGGAAAIETGGAIVRSAARAPGKLPKAPTSNSADTPIERLNPTLLIFESWSWV